MEELSEEWKEIKRLRAEAAALRREHDEVLDVLGKTVQGREAAKRELAEARALLAEVEQDMAEGSYSGTLHHNTRAFLRRDEARQVARWNPSARQCSGEGCTTFGHGEKCPARDEARRCEHDWDRDVGDEGSSVEQCRYCYVVRSIRCSCPPTETCKVHG